MKKALVDEQWMNNRERRRYPRKQKLFWCWGCDANLVAAGPKCSVCGCRNIKVRRAKK